MPASSIPRKNPPMPFPLYSEWKKHADEMFENTTLLEYYTKYYPVLITAVGLKKLSQTSALDLKKIINDALLNELELGISHALTPQQRSEIDAILRNVVAINKRFKRIDYQDAKEILAVMTPIIQSNDRKELNKLNDQLIPNISSLPGSSLGVSDDFSIRKLSKNDPKDIVTSLMMGHFMGCCQRVGAVGESGAIHTVTSEKSGIYVLTYKDQLLAESWALYSEKIRTLCL